MVFSLYETKEIVSEFNIWLSLKMYVLPRNSSIPITVQSLWVYFHVKFDRILQKAAQENQFAALRHYGDAKEKVKDSRAKTKTRPVALVKVTPQIPEVKQRDHNQQKLHYKTNDGASFI